MNAVDSTVMVETMSLTATRLASYILVKEPSDENNVNLLQISSSEKSRPVFSFQKFAKTSHPSRGLDLPRRSAYFPGNRLFRSHVKKRMVTVHTACKHLEKSAPYHSALTPPFPQVSCCRVFGNFRLLCDM